MIAAMLLLASQILLLSRLSIRQPTAPSAVIQE